MAHHNCSESGCGFYLPENYPFSKCPWHLAPTSDRRIRLAVASGALLFLSAGYGLSKLTSMRRARFEKKAGDKAREEWRRRSEARKQRDPTSFLRHRPACRVFRSLLRYA